MNRCRRHNRCASVVPCRLHKRLFALRIGNAKCPREGRFLCRRTCGDCRKEADSVDHETEPLRHHGDRSARCTRRNDRSEDVHFDAGRAESLPVRLPSAFGLLPSMPAAKQGVVPRAAQRRRLAFCLWPFAFHARGEAGAWCRGWESNPHAPYGAQDFKSCASASFATPAQCDGLSVSTTYEGGPVVTPSGVVS